VDTRQLKYFIAVIDHRGFSRAAEHLQIAQPSLSQAIAGFERELGVPLFHRVGRGVVPTDAGDHLVAPARRVLRALDAARTTIDAVKGVTTGRVEIITTASPGVEPLATIVRSFTALHPDVTINITVADVPDDVMQAVRTGSSEIGLLGAARLPQPADLNVLPLEDQELVLVTAPGGSLTGRTRVTADDLRGRRLVVAQRGSLMRQFVDDMLAGGITVTVAADVAPPVPDPAAGPGRRRRRRPTGRLDRVGPPSRRRCPGHRPRVPPAGCPGAPQGPAHPGRRRFHRCRRNPRAATRTLTGPGYGRLPPHIGVPVTSPRWRPT
jgi:DNA-binding transcriptional LysR family regulator